MQAFWQGLNRSQQKSYKLSVSTSDSVRGSSIKQSASQQKPAAAGGEVKTALEPQEIDSALQK